MLSTWISDRANLQVTAFSVVTYFCLKRREVQRVGKSAIWDDELENCCFQNTVIRFRPKAVSSKFALVAFQHFARNSVFARVSKAVGIHHLSADRFASMPFLLPPIEEQTRIVAKVEELFSDLDVGIAALKRAKANLKRYRAAVLKAAVEGKLTEEWRGKHPAKETASTLLARILKERRQKWEADQLAKFAAAKKEPPKNWREKYAEPKPPDAISLAELPEGWRWTRMEPLACDESNSIGAGPFGTIFKAHDFRPEGIPIIFLRHVQPGVYLTRKPGFMDRQKWEELFKNEYSVFGGELLVTKLGDPPGTAAIYPNELGPAMVTPDVIKMSPRNDIILTEFLMHYMNSSVGRAFSSGVAFGTTRLRLTLPLFKDLPVPLPPLQEQAKIVTEIAETFSQIDSAEAAIGYDMLRAARLRQSILKQAFEGKLVPQDPKDEPASVLLDRLRHQPVSS